MVNYKTDEKMLVLSSKPGQEAGFSEWKGNTHVLAFKGE